MSTSKKVTHIDRSTTGTQPEPQRKAPAEGQTNYYPGAAAIDRLLDVALGELRSFMRGALGAWDADKEAQYQEAHKVVQTVMDEDPTAVEKVRQSGYITAAGGLAYIIHAITHDTRKDQHNE